MKNEARMKEAMKKQLERVAYCYDRCDYLAQDSFLHPERKAANDMEIARLSGEADVRSYILGLNDS